MGEKNIFLLFIFGLILSLSSISADFVAVNAGGNNELCVNAGGNVENCFFCFPRTCAQLGYNCDTWSDGCGATLNCGTCASGYTCSSGVCTATPSTPSGGAGGGGGYVQKKVVGLNLVPDNLNLATTINAIIPAKIDVYNIGSAALEIRVSLTNSLDNIVSIKESSFSLGSNKLKTVNLQITAPSEAGIYTGKIRFIVEGKVQEVPFVLNVREGLSLFDISVDIAEENRVINVGESLKGQVTLIQAGIQEPMDVSLHYIVKDYNDNTYLEESETLMVHKQKSYEHEFNTQTLPFGDYIIGAEVIYEGGVATASYPFQVIEKEPTQIQLIYIILAVILLFAIISILLLIKYYKRQKRNYKKRK